VFVSFFFFFFSAFSCLSLSLSIPLGGHTKENREDYETESPEPVTNEAGGGELSSFVVYSIVRAVGWE
jgi:hypothetical protein